jgi:hypothetical protein
MKDYFLKINIWDLLQKPWTKDIVNFENKFHKEFENITKNGIKWKIELLSLSKDSILVDILNLSLDIINICDICGEETINKIKIINFEIKFIKKYKLLKWEEYNENDFFLNERDGNIDLTNVIYQIINWENKIINVCETCKKQTKSLDDDNYNNIENKITWK